MADLDQVRIRTAIPSDADALRDLDGQTPDLLGDTEITVDLGEDWFAPTRLMENPTVLVAELGSRVVGVLRAAVHDARVAGADRRMVMTHQVRVLPDIQGKGLGFQLVADLVSRLPNLGGGGSFYFFVARENAASQAFARGNFNKWERAPYQVWLRAGDQAGDLDAYAASEADAPAVVVFLNTAHEREEFFLPYTEESFCARLGRAPDLYSWGDVLVGRAAAVGLGRATRKLTWRRDGEVVREEVEAAVLDHGCSPGGEEELEALLRAACARACANGATVVRVFASDGGRCSSVIDSLAAERLDLDLWTPSISEPTGDPHGVYVDAVYY